MNQAEKNGRYLLSKVPEVTIFFWIIKILCTTVGETFSDFINENLGLGLINTTIIMGIAFFAVVYFQFRATKYIPGLYWLTVVLISVFGTLVTDNLTDGMSVPLEFSTILFSILLLLTFLFWFLKEKTLSIHSIYTRRREVFYWLTILFTFALGTAVGDLYSEHLGLGYLPTGILVASIIICVFLVYRFLKLDAVLSFWVAYIFTRPLGASIGDFLSNNEKLKIKSFGLDRISNVEVHYTRQLRFDDILEDSFKYSFGVSSTLDEIPQEIILSFTPHQGQYIKSLPLHHSQEIVTDNEKELRIKVKLCPTFDFTQEILSHGQNVTVISPQSFRDEIAKTISEMYKKYK